MRTVSRILIWTMVALLGVAVAVALAWSVSRLAGQRIGLSSVPPSVAGSVAPRPERPSGPSPAGSVTRSRRTGPPGSARAVGAVSDDAGDSTGGAGGAASSQPDD